MQGQCFSVAVVADDSHPQHRPLAEAEQEQAPGAGQGLVRLQTWVAVLRKIWPVWCDLRAGAPLPPPEPLAESLLEFLTLSPEIELFSWLPAAGKTSLEPTQDCCQSLCPLCLGPLVMLQETARAGQGGWPVSSLHFNPPGSVFWLWPAQPSQKELERKCFWPPPGWIMWISQAFLFSLQKPSSLSL